MNKTQRTLTTGLKLAICLIAIAAIGYTQMVTEGLGGSYGGPSLHSRREATSGVCLRRSSTVR